MIKSKNNKRLRSLPVQNETCFSVYERLNVKCENQKCRYWFQHSDFQNCVINAANKRTFKQEELGNLYGLTRMRVCQLEKLIINQLRDIKDLLNLNE